MNEHDIVVEDEEIHYDEAQFNDKCQEVAYECTWSSLSLSVVVCQFEEISIPILHCKVNDSDKEEIKECC